MKKSRWIALGSGVLCAVIPALAVVATSKLVAQRLTPSEFPWSQNVANRPGSGMQPGVDTVFVAGDGTKHELYSIVFKIPAHTAIQPHSHPDDRLCFVLSGQWYFAYGSKRDESKFKTLPPGSSYTEPGNTVHFAGTRNDNAVLECTAVGPTGTTFVNPADDPRNK
jgi:quercetin dioxygenase-like cupin family protein